MENTMSLEISESDVAKSEIMGKSVDFKQKKMYSLIPDLITGWKPKNIKIPSPIIIKYKSPLVTQLIDYYEDDINKLIYIGPRYTNSLMFHEHISHDYILKFGITTEDIPKLIQKELSFEDQAIKRNRLFEGMNPKIKDSNLIFNSHFESGNLDLVIEVGQNEYNLFLRPDTNTCGHMQWFYFTVKNKDKTKVKFNICNNRKVKTLFERGMKPYIHSKENKGSGWQQGGQNLSYSQLHLKEQNQEKAINGIYRKVNTYENNYCLSFEYMFQYENDEVSFAYSPPYTFSHLKNVIMQLKKNYNCFETIISEQKLCTSLSGVDIPLLTITDSSVNNEQKMCLVTIGRIHPGQSNGSYVVQGFLRFILSEEARQMRKNVVFKVIPMINPDGVIFGNYRTSLSGKDLNRMFKTKNQDLIPEVSQLKSLVKKLKYQEKYKISYFLDFHGHSLKKNVFFYGPEYDIWSIKYEKSKILPKILARKTELFRMKSCQFKVASVKRSTARAFMLSYIPYCYTVQSSLGLYRDCKNQDQPFTIKKWNQVGLKIGQSILEIVEKLVQSSQNALKRKEKKKKNVQRRITENVKENDTQSILSPKNKENEVNAGSTTYLNPIRNLKKRTMVLQQRQMKQIHEIEEEDCESDGFSEGNSDCESVEDDLPKVQYERLRQKIVNLMDNFQILVIGNKKQPGKLQRKAKKQFKVVKARQSSKKKSSEKMLLVPSLKHRIDKLGYSEKKISVMNSLQNIDTPAPQKISRYMKND